MVAQIKIDQNTPPIDIKEKTIQGSVEKGLKEIKIKSNDPIEIDTEKIVESSKVKIKPKKESKQQLIIGKKEEEKGSNRRLEISDENLEQIKDATNKVLEQINIQLDFSYDKELNRMVVKVINKETGEVVRQIPPEEMLKIAKRMEEMVGVLLDKWS